MNRRQFEQLSAAGGFESLNPNRAQMLRRRQTVAERHAQSLALESEIRGRSVCSANQAAETALGIAGTLPKVPNWRSARAARVRNSPRSVSICRRTRSIAARSNSRTQAFHTFARVEAHLVDE
jgi:DNA polymerase III alpha subunit